LIYLLAAFAFTFTVVSAVAVAIVSAITGALIVAVAFECIRDLLHSKCSTPFTGSGSISLTPLSIGSRWALPASLLCAIERRHHTGLVALGFASFDILLALVFLFLIASLTTLLLSLLNLATTAWGGLPLLDLQSLLNGLAQEPEALEFAWVHFMMLSTLIPTLIHFLVAGFAAVLLLPETWRD